TCEARAAGPTRCRAGTSRRVPSGGKCINGGGRSACARSRPRHRRGSSLPLHSLRMLANKFQLVRELGRGAFGVVYEAKDTYLDRLVAIKTIRDEVFTSDDVQQSFEQRF